MKTAAEHDAEQYRNFMEQNLARLRSLRQGLLQTQLVIERAALAYVDSRWTLDRIEQKRSNSDLIAPDPPPPRVSLPAAFGFLNFTQCGERPER